MSNEVFRKKIDSKNDLNLMLVKELQNVFQDNPQVLRAVITLLSEKHTVSIYPDGSIGRIARLPRKKRNAQLRKDIRQVLTTMINHDNFRTSWNPGLPAQLEDSKNLESTKRQAQIDKLNLFILNKNKLISKLSYVLPKDLFQKISRSFDSLQTDQILELVAKFADDTCWNIIIEALQRESEILQTNSHKGIN